MPITSAVFSVTNHSRNSLKECQWLQLPIWMPIILAIPLWNANNCSYSFGCQSFQQFPYGMPTTSMIFYKDTTLMKGDEPISTIYTLKSTYYSSMWNLSNMIQFRLFLVFNSYLKFHRFNLNKTSCIWNFTYLSTTFIKKYFKLPYLLVLIPVKSQIKKTIQVPVWSLSFLTHIWS